LPARALDPDPPESCAKATSNQHSSSITPITPNKRVQQDSTNGGSAKYDWQHVAWGRLYRFADFRFARGMSLFNQTTFRISHDFALHDFVFHDFVFHDFVFGNDYSFSEKTKS
jgi:hypothetical protein